MGASKLVIESKSAVMIESFRSMVGFIRGVLCCFVVIDFKF